MPSNPVRGDQTPALPQSNRERVWYSQCMLLILSVLSMVACGEKEDLGPELTPPASCDGPEVSLEAGEYEFVGQGSSGCFTLASTGNYVIALLDGRWIDSARAGQEEPSLPELETRIASTPDTATPAMQAVTWIPGPSVESLGRVSTGVPEPTAVTSLVGAEDCSATYTVYCQTTPWELGDTIFSSYTRYQINDSLVRGTDTLQVVSRDGHLVAAVNLSAPEIVTPSQLQVARQVLATLNLQVFPLLRELLDEELPVTSPGSGQLLVIMTPVEGGIGAGSSGSYDFADGARSHLEFSVSSQYETAEAVATLVPMLIYQSVRTWQHIEDWRLGQASGFRPARARWGHTGGALFVAREVYRRLLGIEPNANVDIESLLREGTSYAYRSLLTGGLGRVPFGTTGGDFLTYLLPRLTEHAGEGLDAALYTLYRQSLEGWFGYFTPGEGLAKVTEELIPGGPERAMLVYALAHALDDRTGNPDLQNLAVENVWQLYGWQPIGTIRLNQESERTISSRWGSILYATIEANGSRPVFVSSDGARLVWAVARY